MVSFNLILWLCVIYLALFSFTFILWVGRQVSGRVLLFMAVPLLLVVFLLSLLILMAGRGKINMKPYIPGRSLSSFKVDPRLYDFKVRGSNLWKWRD